MSEPISEEEIEWALESAHARSPEARYAVEIRRLRAVVKRIADMPDPGEGRHAAWNAAWQYRAECQAALAPQPAEPAGVPLPILHARDAGLGTIEPAGYSVETGSDGKWAETMRIVGSPAERVTVEPAGREAITNAEARSQALNVMLESEARVAAERREPRPAAEGPIKLRCRRCGESGWDLCATCSVLARYAEGEEPPWLNDVLRVADFIREVDRKIIEPTDKAPAALNASAPPPAVVEERQLRALLQSCDNLAGQRNVAQRERDTARAELAEADARDASRGLLQIALAERNDALQQQLAEKTAECAMHAKIAAKSIADLALAQKQADVWAETANEYSAKLDAALSRFQPTPAAPASADGERLDWLIKICRLHGIRPIDVEHGNDWRAGIDAARAKAPSHD